MLPPFGGIERSGHQIIRSNTAICPSCRRVVDATIKKNKNVCPICKTEVNLIKEPQRRKIRRG